MRRRMLLLVVVASAGGLATDIQAQISTFPYRENFDSVQPPALPPGWSSTRNRDTSANDFATSTTNPFSAPHAVGSTNARISQTLFSPLFDFSVGLPDTLSFRVARSSTHTARMLVEASTDGGATYSHQLGDSLRYPGVTTYTLIKLGLPSALFSEVSVRFRWRILGDPLAGATATLRMDDIVITARASDDLELGSVRFDPPAPTEGEPVTAIAKIRNLGLRSAQNFAAEFYIDANNDSLPQPSELRSVTASTAALAAGDSVELAGDLGSVAAGLHLTIVRIVYPPDQNPANNLRRASLAVGYRAHSVVVNEIMYAPTSPEPEWVELVNIRTDSISLRSWFIADSSRTQRRITTQDIKIPPGGYAVLTGNPAALLNIHPDIPSIIIGVSSFPSLNNSGDAVILYDSRSFAMDSVRYLPAWGGNTGGRSLERIDPEAPSVQQFNWGSCRLAERSTPGLRNSLTRKDRDLAVDTLRFLPSLPVLGDSVTVSVKVKNAGRESAATFLVQVFDDVNADSLPQPGELIATAYNTFPLAPLDSISYDFTVGMPTAGVHTLLGRVEFAGDEDTTNNMRFGRVIVGYPAGSVRINEIMYAPATGAPEWIELFNTRSDTVELTGWLLGNRSQSSRYEIGAARLFMAPQQLVVITKDTALFREAYPFTTGSVAQLASLPTFLWNNGGDAVVVVDSRRLIMDSVMYSSSWGGTNGRSLERIDPLGVSNDSTNWVTSSDSMGSTPARTNSHVLLDHDLRLVRVSADTAHPGRSAHLVVVVRNVGRLPAASFIIELFDDADGDSVGAANEMFYQQTFADVLARRDSLVIPVEWSNPTSGIHTVLAQVVYPPDERLSNNRATVAVRVGYPRKVLVVNEIMYAPLSEGAEYVELTNVGAEPVDLTEWSIRDRAGSSGANVIKLGHRGRLLSSGEYFVVSSDSSILRSFPSVDTALVVIVNQSSLSLNNSGDDVVLVDPTGLVIDSVAYIPSWHNPNVRDVSGRSLERINPLLPSGDGRNWSTCTHPLGGTPGRQNSVFAATLPSSSKLTISPNPFSPDGDGREDFAVLQYELPLTVSMIRIRIYDAAGRRIRTLANNEPSGSRGSIVWDGLDDERRKARVGIHVILLEAIDDRGGVVETVKAAVVVAAKL